MINSPHCAHCCLCISNQFIVLRLHRYMAQLLVC
uniref:Uncharacterized protein n=1 Tax=Arundo donax TaxID=35708 RepID=A0A0A9HP83_ARUDO